MARVLIIDDDPGVRYTIRKMLEAAGHDACEASTGTEALDALDAAQADAIVLDLMLPRVNGLQLLSTLQSSPQHRSIPTLIVTGAMTSAADVRQLGARGLLRKPFTTAQLTTAVDTMLRRAAPPGTQTDTPARVLIVEDDPDSQQLLETVLQLEGYKTMVARNGLQGLELMRARRPCAVVLDLMMPGMDGWQFRRQQLREPALAAVPVVCVTGVANPEEVERQLGVACLRKPIDVDRLLDEVQARCASR